MTARDTDARYPSLASRTALVTGGAAGIGAATVRALSAQGARTVFLDIDEPGGARLAAETGARFLPCDLTDIAALRETVAAAAEETGGIDVLVNNAARDDRQAFSDIEPESWRHMLALNLDHQFFATQVVAGTMAAHGGGSVIMTGSISWMRGMPGMAGYTTAKAAINGLTRTLARELGPDGIRVNCIVPGAILTERQTALWLTPDKERAFLEQQALKFRLLPDHVARLTLFLASDESAGCTGANFVCDAGLSSG